MSGKNRILCLMAEFMNLFDEYAGRDGNPDTLTKAEVKAMLESEMFQMVKTAKNQAEVDKLWAMMDADKNAEVDFKEFMVLVASLTCACHGRHRNN